MLPVLPDLYNQVSCYNSISSQNATNIKFLKQRIVLSTNPTPLRRLVTSALTPRGTDSWVKQAMPWPTPVRDASSAGPLYRDGLKESFLLFKKGLFPEGFVFIRTEIAVMRKLRRKFETVECFTFIILNLHHIVN